MKKERIKIRGRIIEALPSLVFKVELETGEKVLAYLGGKMRRYSIKILPGDDVLVELSLYDRTRGRIVYRH